MNQSITRSMNISPRCRSIPPNISSRSKSIPYNSSRSPQKMSLNMNDINVKEDETYNENQLYKWVTRQRGDKIPIDAVLTGSNITDGKMYIGKINDNPTS